MGFEPKTLHDLALQADHWATEDSVASKGEMWVFDWNHIVWSWVQILSGTWISFRVDIISTFFISYIQ